MPEYLIQTVGCNGSDFEYCKDEQELKEKIRKIKKYFSPYNKILGIYQKVKWEQIKDKRKGDITL